MDEKEEKNQENGQEYSIGSFSNIDNYTQNASRAVLQAIRSGHTLPSHGDDYDYYSSFESFRTFMDIESTRLLQIIQQIMRYHGLKGNLTTSSAAFEIEEKFDVLVDANDQILERAGSFIDEASGVKKETPLLIASATNKQATAQGCWNKKGRSAASTKGFSFRLLSAKNIQRPQLKFKDKVDNTYRTFIPKIKEKPNAMKSLTEIMKMQVEDDVQKTDDNIVYPHPYQYELDHLEPSADQLARRNPQMAAPLDDSTLAFINTEDKLKELCDELKTCCEFAVDLEHHSYRTFLGITCLMQISTRSKDYIIDTLELRSEMQILNEVFTDPNIVKVLHGADSDIEWLQRDFGLYMVNMFDTGQAARVLGFSRFSLAHLMQHFCGVDPDKQFQLADWRIRPLPDELIKYAREDTHYLLYIYDRMHSDLLTRGNEQNNLLVSVFNRSRQICAKKYEKPVFNDEVHLELYRKSKKVFNSQQLHALKGLSEWRDKTARIEDESIGYVLPNHMLLQIAETLPRDPQGVLACCNPIPPLVRQNAIVIHSTLKAAREVPLYKVENTRSSLKPTRLEHPKYNVTALLHCPHDTSHSSKRPDTEIGQGLQSIDDLVTTYSRLFGPNSAPIQQTSRIETQSSLFSTLNHKPKTISCKKVEDILATFENPFDMYFPLRSDQSQTVGSADKMKLSTVQDKEKWRLKPHTVNKPKDNEVEDKTPKLEIIKSAETMHFNAVEEDEIQPLRKQLPNKRALKKEKLQAETASFENERNAEGSHQESRLPSDDEPINKRVKPSVEQLESSGFKAHDYNKTDYIKMFTDKSQGRGRGRGGDRGRGGRGRGGGRYYNKNESSDFNPHQQPTTSDHRAVSAPKSGGASKSMSYKKGGSESKAKIHWPKR